MLEAKTHFKQVPLEIVKEILEKQIELETVVEPVRVSKKTFGKRPSRAEGNQSRGKR